MDRRRRCLKSVGAAKENCRALLGGQPGAAVPTMSRLSLLGLNLGRLGPLARRLRWNDWIFAPGSCDSVGENHFGVLSLEGFGLRGGRRRISGRGDSLLRALEQRGSLDQSIALDGMKARIAWCWMWSPCGTWS